MEVCCLSVFRHQQALARHTEFWTAPKCDCQITCSIMYKRSCLADAHLHWKEGHRNCYVLVLEKHSVLGSEGKRAVANAQRCKLFYTLLHSCTRNSLWCQSSSSTETPEEKQLAVNWLHVRSHTYIIYLVDSQNEYSGAVLHCPCVLAYNFCRLEQASVFRATVFALVSGPNDRPFLSLMIAGHGGHGVPRNTERYQQSPAHSQWRGSHL